MFTFQSYKWLFAKLSKFTKQQLFSLKMVLGCLRLGGLSLNVDIINCLIILEFKTLHNTVQCWKSGVTPLNLLWSDMTWNNYKVNYWFRQKWNRDEAKKMAKSILAVVHTACIFVIRHTRWHSYTKLKIYVRLRNRVFNWMVAW